MKTKNSQLKFNTCKELLYNIAERKLNVSKNEILSKKRDRVLADTRRTIMSILKSEFPSAKVVTIGQAVSRNHSNVSIQLKNHEELIQKRNEYSSLYNLINDEFHKKSHFESCSINELYEIKQKLENDLKIVKSTIYNIKYPVVTNKA